MDYKNKIDREFISVMREIVIFLNDDMNKLNFSNNNQYYAGNEARLLWQLIRLNKTYQKEYDDFDILDDKADLHDLLPRKWNINKLVHYSKARPPKDFRIFRSNIYKYALTGNYKMKVESSKMLIEDEIKRIGSKIETPISITFNPNLPKAYLVTQIKKMIDEEFERLASTTEPNDYKKMNKRMISSLPLAIVVHNLVSICDIPKEHIYPLLTDVFKFKYLPVEEHLKKKSFIDDKVKYINELVNSGISTLIF